LWASTSTKNPAYDELMYVEPLIGPHTVTTLPRKTGAAFAAHGKAAATLEQGQEEAAEIVRDLTTAGIDLAQVTRELLDEGIEKFVAAFDDVVQTIAAKAGRTARAASEQRLGGQ
jgi:transaldolase